MRHGMTMRLAVLALWLVSIVQGQSGTEQCLPGCEYCGNSGDKREFNCAGLELGIQDNTREAFIDCNGQLLDCSKLPELDFGRGKQIRALNIRRCSLNSSLECVLALLNSTGAATLTFMQMQSAVSADTLRGLELVKTLFVINSSFQTSFPNETLELLPNLFMIRLTNDCLTDIPSDAFTSNGDPALNYLEIGLNNITNLPDNAFSGLRKLETLSLFKNRIRTVEANAFNGLVSLRELILDDNEISGLPAGVFQQTPQLEMISMQRNQRELHLRSGVLSGLSRLNKLVLQSYDLKLDPDSLSSLPSLTTLDMDYSDIKALPNHLFRNSTAIITLTMKNNKISSIPETVFEGLENLQKLFLSNNELKEVTGNTFAALGKLNELYLDGNHIEVLPERLFSTIRGLKTVSFARNLLKTVNENAFQGASYLQNLYLNNNMLNWSCLVQLAPSDSYEAYFEIPSPLSLLDRLEKLDLSHNYISAICSDWTQTMTRLKELNLAYNNLTELSSADMRFVSNKINVNLSNNRITTIQSDNYFITNPLPNLVLGHNPFRCDCILYNFLTHLKELPFNVEDAMCNSPAPLKDISLDTIATGKLATQNVVDVAVSLKNLTCPLPRTPEGCECISRPAESRTECVCDDITNITLPDPALSDGSYKMMLTLKSIHNLQMLPSFVNYLNLSYLELDSVPYIPMNVTHIDLSHNNLGRVPLGILQRNLSLELLGNPLNCGCGSLEDVRNLFKYNMTIGKFDNLTCSDGFSLKRKDPQHLCDVYYAKVYNTCAVLISIFVISFGIIIYKYRLRILVCLANWGCGCISEDLLDQDKKYDIFLSYCHDDEDYLLKVLLPKLDKNYKVCLHTRDFDVGDTITNNIYRSVADSKRTVIVFSEAFLKSVWCIEEFRAAHIQAATDKRTRAIVILREDIDLQTVPKEIKAYLGVTTYIKWDDPTFWSRLTYALPRKLKVEDVRIKKVTELAVKNLSGGLNIVYNEEGKLVNAADLIKREDV